ncbi:general substrate transporter [Boletus edulis BED1]|uniref:General substrate transporter n=1 Tax=Boletus edulis BED1 TaxID=1328754 RepID=A0AAD4BWU6_BOLED|nr:general substrate transporter [Boletus edulis BED1]
MNLKKEFEELLHYRNAYFLAFSATTGYVCFGWDIGLIGGVLALPSFQQYFGLDKESAAARAALSGNIVSVLQAGGFFGAMISTWFANRYGRKPSMLASAIVFFIGSVVQSIVGLGSTPAVGLKLFYFGRFFGGVGVGLMSALVPTYVTECAPRTIRGRCTGSIEVAVGLGNMLIWVNYGVSTQIPFGEIQWRLPIIVQIIPGVLFFFLMLFQPESPRWLVEKERYDDAAKSLAYIARTDPRSPSVQFTLSEIRADFVGRRQLGLVTQFRKMGESRMIALRCIIPSLLTFFQQWSGTNAINYYSPQIFTALGISSTTASLLATGIYGVVKFLTTCLVLAFLIDARSWGRKRTLFYGGLAQALMMIWLGGYAAIHPQPTLIPATYLSILAIYLFGVAFCLGWGMTPLVLGSEIAPGHLRPAVMSLATGVTWLFSYVIAEVTPRMLARIRWGTYVVFGVAGVLMAGWAWVGVPETTGVPLEDVTWLFHDGGEGVWTRFVQDAPGGGCVLRVLGKRRVTSVEELQRRVSKATRSLFGNALVFLGSNRGKPMRDRKL